jgi:hypothetical protein
MLRAAVVAPERVEGLGQPPPPGLERRPTGTIESAIARREVAFEQGRNVAPLAPLVVRHVGEGRREHAVGSDEVAADVAHQTAQRLAPPCDGAALLDDAGGQQGLAAFQEITHPLANDPLVARDSSSRPVESVEEAGARLTNPIRLFGCLILLVVAALVPVAHPPDALAAHAAPAPRSFRKIVAPRVFERLLRPPGGLEDGSRIRLARRPRARDH